ncbi:hypothetical protein K1X84_00020 [bacterium]|nr:hypothetical protein [bacterium]
MHVSLSDRSLYFKGLLLLIRKDRFISDTERILMLRIGKALSFEKEFCETAVHNILQNEHITDTPPVFDDPLIAQYFIHDALTLACSDRTLHPQEEEWLKAVCLKNGLSESWFLDEKRKIVSSPTYDWSSVHLTVDRLTYT